MEINEAFVLQSIGSPTLAPIARRSSRRDEFEMLDWRIDQIAGGLGNPVSAGLYRLEGTGLSGREVVPWSAILKVIQSPANVGESNMGEGEDPTHWNYWKRELLVYQSGFLDTLPNGLTAPRFLGANELPGDVACLWLEDIADDYRDAWPLERYALATRHLGRLNGMHAGNRTRAMDYPWLGRRRLWQWRDQFPEWREIPWDHPLTRALYPPAEVTNLRRLLHESEDYLARLERLPQTLCHGDAYPTNFKSRRAAGGEQTVALDWALAHTGPLGYDLAPLILGAYLNLPGSDLPQVDRALFDGYMAGLGDSGYDPAPAAVRFGYAASAVLLVALFQLMMLHYDIQAGKVPAGDEVTPAGARPCFEGAMADIACQLRDLV